MGSNFDMNMNLINFNDYNRPRSINIDAIILVFNKLSFDINLGNLGGTAVRQTSPKTWLHSGAFYRPP